MTAPLFYAKLPESGEVTLLGDEARHAGSAMRLRPGQQVLVCDGAGRVGTCLVTAADRRSVTARIDAILHVEAPPELTVIQALPKGERGELAVELLTETGVSRIVPWASARTVADWRGKEAAKVDRWRRVAFAAAKQARRAHLPQVADLLVGVPEATFVLHEDASQQLYRMDLPVGPITVVVGPEGGLTDDEIEAMGGVPVRLGSEILRTSTAGAAACLWIRGVQAHCAP
jgi:16S rRNA (uracil1498-N3)-methyltransferase